MRDPTTPIQDPQLVQSARVWDSFLADLSPSVRAAFSRQTAAVPAPAEEPDDDVDDLRSSLGPLARAGLENMAAVPPAPSIDLSVARYHLVECPDGEMSHVTSFKTADGIARRVADLDGQDMEVWGFFGIPMLLSKGPQRYLSLPDGEQAITIPRGGGPIRLVDITLLTAIKPQDDGYIGPPELAHARVERVLPPPRKIRHGPVGDGDDEDDEDDGEGAEVDS